MPLGACILRYWWFSLSPKACIAVLCFVSFFGPGLTEFIAGRQNIAPNSVRSVSLVSLSAFLGFASSVGLGLTESIVERQHIPPTWFCVLTASGAGGVRFA